MKKKFVQLGIDHPHYRAVINAVKKRSDIDFGAVAQETPPLADNVAAEHGVRVYNDYLECIENEKPEIAGIAMYNGERGKWIAELLSRGIAVIADKPLCLTLEELENIRAALKKTGAPLCMMLTCRSNPVYMAVKNAVRDNLIGDILGVDACRYYALNRPSRPDWMFDEKKYGGPGIDILCHDYDLAEWITGIAWDDIKLREFRTGRYSDEDFKDAAYLISEDRKRLLDIKVYWHSPKGHWDRFSIYGTMGMIDVPFVSKKPLLINNAGEVKELELPVAVPLAEQFFSAVIDGSAALPVSAEDSISITEKFIKAKRQS
ncbi:MAG: hypothetical protein A2017_20540 [Lentisphaerae bacterium GWF2_44_16]|nr:MAG: hypothetical protein A2017_20540 [Lentisphaerae bacterium GWF2_44_16]